jgi:hypothetical protein
MHACARRPELRSAVPDPLVISLMSDFTMINLEFVWGARAYITISSYGTVHAGKMHFLVQISIWLFLKSYGESYGEFFEPGFPYNFARNDRQNLKMDCVDASRHQLRSVLKIRL